MESNIVEQIKKANKLLNEYIPIAESIAKQIADAVKEATGIELSWSLGGPEWGVDCLWFEFKDITRSFKNKIPLAEIVSEVFPELKESNMYVDGEFFTKKEAEKIKKALVKLRRKDESSDKERSNKRA